MENFKGTYYGDDEDDMDNLDDIVEFVACGKNEVLDADMNYPLDQDAFASKPKEGEEEQKNDSNQFVGTKRLYKYIEPV